MSEKLEQAEAKYDELVDAVQALSKKMTEFRRLTSPSVWTSIRLVNCCTTC